MTIGWLILIFICAFLFGVLVLGFLLHKRRVAQAFEEAGAKSQRVIEQTQKDADRVIKSAIQESKEESLKRRRAFEEEIRKKRADLNTQEQRYREKESELKEAQDELSSKEKKLRDLEQKLISDEKQALRVKAEYEISLEKNQKTLEKIAKMSVSEAKRRLMDILEEAARKECYPEIKKIEQEAYKKANQKAKKIISLAVQKIAGNYVNDNSVTVVQLPNDEMKGRIIGREGRNIRMIEQSVGVDLIIDDTPEAVIISSFSPIRREIAKLSLEKLIADGRIHPARIEETVSRVESEMEATIKEFGDQASFDIGVTDLHPHLLSLLGKLRFRSVGAQSVLQHSVETANICGMIAGELGVDISKAKRAGLLHDIGKAVDQDTEGHHATVGAEICRQYGEDDEIVSAISQHHSDHMKEASILAVLLSSANHLSTNRPGARKELLASYIKRLERMEELILEFPHVKKVYVLQSGREIRVIVEPEKVTDYALKELTDNVAKKLRQELTFPGQVRITAIKESRQIEYAS